MRTAHTVCPYSRATRGQHPGQALRGRPRGGRSAHRRLSVARPDRGRCGASTAARGAHGRGAGAPMGGRRPSRPRPPLPCRSPVPSTARATRTARRVLGAGAAALGLYVLTVVVAVPATVRDVLYVACFALAAAATGLRARAMSAQRATWGLLSAAMLAWAAAEAVGQRHRPAPRPDPYPSGADVLWLSARCGLPTSRSSRCCGRRRGACGPGCGSTASSRPSASPRWPAWRSTRSTRRRAAPRPSRREDEPRLPARRRRPARGAGHGLRAARLAARAHALGARRGARRPGRRRHRLPAPDDLRGLGPAQCAQPRLAGRLPRRRGVRLGRSASGLAAGAGRRCGRVAARHGRPGPRDGRGRRAARRRPDPRPRRGDRDARAADRLRGGRAGLDHGRAAATLAAAQDALRDSEERTRRIVESSTMPSSRSTRRASSPAGTAVPRRSWGGRPPEAIGQPVALLAVPPDLRRRPPRELRGRAPRRRRAPVRRPLDAVVMRRDGARLTVELTLTSVELGGAMTFCAFARDVTRRRRVEERLRASEMRYRQLRGLHPRLGVDRGRRGRHDVRRSGLRTSCSACRPRSSWADT